jgi:hypothetical protein
MPKLWSNARRIDRYLRDQLPATQRRFFEYRLGQDSFLRKQVKTQRRLHQLIRLSGRRSLKRDLRRVHHDMMYCPEESQLQRRIEQVFGG